MHASLYHDETSDSLEENRLDKPEDMHDEPPPEDLQPSDFGIESLVERWRRLSVHDDIAVGEATIVLGPVGISSQGGVGQPSLSDGPPTPPPSDLVIPVALTLVDLGNKSAEGRLVLSVGQMWRAIFDACANDMSVLQKLTARQFEEFLAGLYDEQNFWDEIILTPQTRDKGRDVIVSATKRGFGTIRILDQARLYSPRRRVSVNEVREMAGILVNDRNVTKVFVTTTADFSRDAYREFRNVRSRVDLRNGLELVDWIKELRQSN